MTRKEATEVIKANYPCGGYHDLCEALDMAIEALDQEPIINKIRAEIQKLRDCSCSCSDGIIDEIEDILDKYKAESEG